MPAGSQEAGMRRRQNGRPFLTGRARAGLGASAEGPHRPRLPGKGLPGPVRARALSVFGMNLAS